jgi:NhaP-type Na+/H+ or K+/H+ antiporter
VTGPTVIGPLLRIVKPNNRVSSVLRWEGIIIDPFGAIAAVVAFEFLKAENRFHAAGEVVLMLLKFAFVGVVIGVAGGFLLAHIIKRRLTPPYLNNVVALALVFAVFAGANHFAEEAGLLSTVVMGLWVANSNVPGISHVLSFKEDLAILAVSSLFIALAANIAYPDLVSLLRWEYAALLLAILFVVRPLNVFVSGIGSVLNLREKLFLSAVAPRGIVAASIASIFAFKLGDTGHSGGDRLLALVFMVIVGTVLISSLTAKPLAKLLKVTEPDAEGFLIVGAHAFARRIAKYLSGIGLPVLVSDTNRSNIATARIEGLNSYYGSVLSGASDGEVDYTGLGRLLALTSNDEANALSAIRFSREFGPDNVYQLAPRTKIGGLAPDTRGHLAFGDDTDFNVLEGMFLNGATIKETRITEEFGYDRYLKEHSKIVPLFLRRNGELVMAEGKQPRAGDTVVSAVIE